MHHHSQTEAQAVPIVEAGKKTKAIKGQKLKEGKMENANCVKTIKAQCHLSIGAVQKASCELEKVPGWLEIVRDGGFGAFVDTNIKSNISLECISFCMMKIDTGSMIMTFAPG